MGYGLHFRLWALWAGRPGEAAAVPRAPPRNGRGSGAAAAQPPAADQHRVPESLRAARGRARTRAEASPGAQRGARTRGRRTGRRGHRFRVSGASRRTNAAPRALRGRLALSVRLQRGDANPARTARRLSPSPEHRAVRGTRLPSGRPHSSGVEGVSTDGPSGGNARDPLLPRGPPDAAGRDRGDPEAVRPRPDPSGASPQRPRDTRQNAAPAHSGGNRGARRRAGNAASARHRGRVPAAAGPELRAHAGPRQTSRARARRESEPPQLEVRLFPTGDTPRDPQGQRRAEPAHGLPRRVGTRGPARPSLRRRSRGHGSSAPSRTPPHRERPSAPPPPAAPGLPHARTSRSPQRASASPDRPDSPPSPRPAPATHAPQPGPDAPRPRT